jgi:hypothetical protein
MGFRDWYAILNKPKNRMPVHSPTRTAQIFLMRNFFRLGKNSPAGLQNFSRKTFPGTRPQFQNDFKTFHYEKIPVEF